MARLPGASGSAWQSRYNVGFDELVNSDILVTLYDNWQSQIPAVGA